MDRDFLKQQVREYLATAETLGQEEKVLLLVNLLEKITILDRATINFTRTDLNLIKATAHRIFLDTKLPLVISGKETDHSDVPHYSMVMATVEYLTLRDALKKQIEVEKK